MADIPPRSPIRKKPVPPPPSTNISLPSPIPEKEKLPPGSVHENTDDESDDGDLYSSPVLDRKEQQKAAEPKQRTAFEKLPREIIQEILLAADPNTFDSLTLINSRWHSASRSVHLYTHQLAQCGVYVLPSAAEEDALPALIRKFAMEARRELFETILRPQVTEIQLICSASSSAAAFPFGEAFRFEFSAKGRYLLAFSSSRIFVLDLSKRKVEIKRELKISKRPVSAAILDDGSILAVLSSNHHVTLYDLKGEKAEYLRSFPLDNEPRTIALSPGAEVLGAAFDGGIEVYSLHPDAQPTDYRAVNCDTVDTLAFSPDGTNLLGTTLNTKSPTTVIVSAQHFSTDMPVETLAELWTTQVLFPRSSRDSSHASLLPEEDLDGGVTWTFTYDRVYETFRAVRVDDLRNGHTYFTGPSNEGKNVIPPSTLPAFTTDGGMVAAGFGSGGVWLYGVPEKLDPPADPVFGLDSTGSTPARSNSGASRSTNRQSSTIIPQWQVLSDQKLNVFIGGREIGHVSGLSGIKFVKGDDFNERLVAVAGGGVDDVWGECGEEERVALGGGRVVLYEFGRGPRVGQKSVISIEIGDGIQGPVETLKEENHDLEVEVDIVRRRTVAMRKNADRRTIMISSLTGRAESTNPPGVSTVRNTSPIPPPAVRRYTTMAGMPGPPPLARNDSPSPPRRPVSVFSPAGDDLEDDENQELPYSHGDPRSRTSLHRAATVARTLPQNTDHHRHARAVGPDGQPIPEVRQQRRTLGIAGEEDRWVPPPPPYTPRKSNEPPLPPHLVWSMQGPPRRASVPDTSLPRTESPSPPRGRPSSTLQRTRSTLETVGNAMRRRSSALRLSTLNTSSRPSTADARSAPVSPTGHHTFGGSAYLDTSTQFNHAHARRASTQSTTLAFIDNPSDIPPVPPIPLEHLTLPQSAQSPRQSVYTVAGSGRSPARSPSRPARNSQVGGQQLTETIAPNATELFNAGAAGTPSRTSSSGGNRRPRSILGSTGGSGSVRRRPSRAERSAARNMLDARRRRQERRDREGEEGKKGRGNACVVM